MHRNKSVDLHQFAMVPRAEIPRSTFRKQFTHKTTFDENYLIPVYVDEILPGDTFQLKMTAFARMSTPIYPLMDNLYLDSFFFFVPCRLVWSNWQKFMGEQNNPGDSISFTIPVARSPAGTGYTANSIFDYMGLPLATDGVTTAYDVNALPFRAYNLIWNQWFRDENLQPSAQVPLTDGPDDAINTYGLAKRGKRHDYFTSALPWTQKGGVAITLPLGTSAPIRTSASAQITGANPGVQVLTSTGATPSTQKALGVQSSTNLTGLSGTLANDATAYYFSNLYADLSQATAATINQLRQSFQIQRLLERDARGGTRYTELLRAHFGVISPDARLQRPEYLGGGSAPVNISPIAQTSATGLTGGTSPLGNLSAYGTLLAHGHGFVQSFTEHGYVIGLVNIRGDVTYQQGLRKMWSRSTRYDFYWPAFAMLGEQAILNKELYFKNDANDNLVFGYQERWGELRYHPSQVTGLFRSTATAPLDAWHLAEKFTALPTLGATFIQQNTPISRVISVTSPGAHFIFDSFFDVKCTRPLPMYSVPGLIDHF